MRGLLALLAGVLNSLSFAPFNYWGLIFVSLGILFCLWLRCDSKNAFWYGFLYGLAMFGIGLSWIYITIHTFGGMPSIIAAICIFLLVAFLSLYPALVGLSQSLFNRWGTSERLIFIIPTIWILFEWLRGWLFTGLPWLTTGYAMLDMPLSNFAPIGGVYLISLIVLISTGLLIAIISNPSIFNGILWLVMVVVWIIGWQLNKTTWTRAEGDSIRVAVIQNNISLFEKWDEKETDKIIQEYLVASASQHDVDLIVWPEVAIPNYLDSLSTDFWDIIRSHPADFVFGILHREQDNQVRKYYNTVAAVSDQIMIYRKQHLVPFGEYFPLQVLLGPLIRWMEIPMSDFSHWRQPQTPLMAAGNRFAVSICYEDAFPQDWRGQIIPSGAFINVSEDIWFGDSFAPHQRLQMARFRSRESERPMIRSSNNGLSSLINWKGRIYEYAPQFQKHVVTGSIQPRIGATPYVIFGDQLSLLIALGLFLLTLLFGRLKVRYNRQPGFYSLISIFMRQL